jgi:predicted nucleic acid-binding protein
LRRLHRKYRDRPISLADACIVRMAEIHDQHAVLTLDSDFMVYRKHGSVPLTVIHPPAT